jgi:cyclopropane fatty-acyl-phospholipid synthase-like methyltransferase
MFPRASACDPALALGGMMGPNALWLTEWASQALDLRPGQQVLDLGCGKAASSIFLAREFGVEVTAADLWISAEANLRRITSAGVQSLVFPVQAEAHALPFTKAKFDTVISLDAYHYFGTDDLYLGHICKILKPGGQIAIVVPCRLDEGVEVPAHLTPYWDWQFCSFHSPAWWRTHWQKTGLIEVVCADALADGWLYWAEWCELCDELARVTKPELDSGREAEMLRVDAGRTFGFARMVGTKPMT